MTNDEYREMNRSGLITDKAKSEHLDLHFCYEWDGLLVYKEMKESECCTCFKKEKE